MYVNKKYKTVNEVLKSEFKISARLLTKLIKGKNIFLNNKICDTRQTININDVITVKFDYDEDNSNIVPTKMKLEIIYEDEWLLVINKPAGYAVHPSALHYDDSISNGVKFYFASIGLKKKIRPINRLDKNTSGLVIFAKCEYIQERLSAQMLNKTFKKEYLAVVSGSFEDKTGIIDMPIARKKGSIIERCVDLSGQKSVTKYSVIKEFDGYSLVKCLLETGRTHQIRVHMAWVRSSTTWG